MIGFQKVNLAARTARPVELTKPRSPTAALPCRPAPGAVQCSASSSSPSDSNPAANGKQQPQARLGRRQLINLAGAAGLATLCPCGVCGTGGEAKADGWGYVVPEVRGPQRWGGSCASGTQQSPVDLPLTKLTSGTPGSAPVVFDFPDATKAAVINTGHGTPMAKIPEGKFKTYVEGRELELIQFHFHSPSEHALDGRHWSMEAHLVHKDVKTGGLCVFGVMLQRDWEIAPLMPIQALQWALAHSPADPATAPATPSKPLIVSTLLPAPNAQGRRPYLRYNGSLTTPPCSEQVDWFVFTDPILVSDKQVLDFQSYNSRGMSLSFSARAPQPIDGRSVGYMA